MIKDLFVIRTQCFSLTKVGAKAFFVALLLAAHVRGISQTDPQVSSDIDSTRMKIGEQLHFEIKVDADSTALVVFPEGQTFSPLEMVEATDIDTFRNKDRFNLTRKYALTQFDSGHYTLPRQKVIINNREFYTDSLEVTVGNIPVDTTKQKMYDIKPLQEVSHNYSGWGKLLLWGLVILLVTGALVYWFFIQKKPLSEAEKEALLPPFDRALLGLKKLEESRYLIQSQYKEYYSELTNIVRAYLEEEVHISAMESTTEELVTKLEIMQQAGKLNLEKNTIANFKDVLQKADLVKFARSRPDTNVAEADRKVIENVVVKTKEAIPEPTEEELLLKAEYLAEMEQKRRKKKRIYIGIAAACLILIATGSAIAYYGFHEVKDSVFGHPSRELLQGEWINSEYGYPSIVLETPKVLRRTEVELPDTMKQVVSTNQTFAYGSMAENLHISASVTTFREGVEFRVEDAVQGAIKTMEQQGAKNLIVKQDEFTTPSGKKGSKVYGSLDITEPSSDKTFKGEYIILNFTEQGAFQQVIIVHRQDDRYAKDIENRIVNSIDFKNK
ncbi:DUF4179 domain-containing protein [Sinomicrobium kalidii]|uniref:DUF4179 domain-containing protein n=1 Tax=Sinomicrobium kalidii TaxID=2900738 RepID=UPI001E37CA49|nr:DUF4179 domain-containing protein [Sinomicrobium kalidii]UGU17804.1 DUF4179 domain-containing protein [Sinomicrobium kalidii]